MPLDSPSPDAAKRPAKSGSGAEPGFRLGYCPGLDGLRGIAILAVVMFHARLAYWQMGYIGVHLFFSLSGFLITSLLVEEWDRFQALAIGRFYLRRILRLFPALVLMLAVFVGFRLLAAPREAGAEALREAATALFYASNWVCVLGPQRPYFLAHTWSLAIEEQFYLLWPLALRWALKRGMSRASLLNWLLLGFAAAIVNRALQYVRWDNPWRLNFGTDTQADSLLLGCALAVALGAALPRCPGLWAARAPGAALGGGARLVLGWCGAAALAGLFWLGASVSWDLGLEVCLGFPLIALLATLTVLGVVAAPASLLGRLVSNRCLVWIGKISYGLYLWHLPVFLETQARHWPLWKELPMELGLTLVFVLASYYGLERPLLRLKARLAGVGGGLGCETKE